MEIPGTETLDTPPERVALTILSTYLPKWRVAEGLRELLQNWLDAGDISAANGEERGTAVYNDDHQALTLTNAGELPREALLLGTTSKADGNARGHFGEGLKLGTLALVRAGASVTIWTGTERWEACLADAAAFPGQRLLTWDITPDDQPGIVVEVGDLDVQDWMQAQAKVLYFEGDFGHHFTLEGRGTVLFDARFRGKVYVRGLYVASVKGLEYGYDLLNAGTDRDREIVSDFDLAYHAAFILAAAEAAGQLAASKVLASVMEGKQDVRYYGSASTSLNEAQQERLAGAFHAAYGPDAIHARDDAEAGRIEALGRRAVKVNHAAAAVLDVALTPTAKQLETAAATEAPGRPEMDADDHAALAWIIARYPVVPVDVANFYAPETRAVWVAIPGAVHLARVSLLDPIGALAEVVRLTETARNGGLSTAWTKIVRTWEAPPTREVYGG
jgi:hypothetical protein